ncbi:unnamed protein product [Camellia sinensis]
MLIMGSSDLPENSIKVKSREVSVPKSSVEVYYGGSPVAIPFVWESQPGTPKVKFHENPLPPLSPPPSFNLHAPRKPKEQNLKRTVSQFFLPKLMRKTSYPPSPASSSSSSRSPLRSVSSSSFTSSNMRGKLEMSSPRSPFDSRIEREDERGESPVSTLCFGISRGGANARSRGSSSNIIKVLLR